MMNEVYKAILPDDKPVTAICIVEDAAKCPKGFFVVSRTHDLDLDADLWKENTFFGRKIVRFLCVSKTEGIADYIVENIGVISEKEMPPDGFCLIPRTIDSEQKAWRKRQMCYRLTRRNLALTAVTDIIFLTRSKKAPEGYMLAGDINGLTVCFKTGNLQLATANSNSLFMYSLNPGESGSAAPSNGIAYPSLNVTSSANGGNSPPHDYEQLVRPRRPAPLPPPQAATSYATIHTYHGLEGIPFVLNPLINVSSGKQSTLPVIKSKTKYQLDKEYEYNFRLERQS